MNKEERHKLILENLISAESIQVAELASLLSVSTVTIRKDLTELENANKLYRSHGRAILANPYINNRSVNEKEKLARREKEHIGQYAATLVEPADSIVIASGIIASQADEIVSAMENDGFGIADAATDNDWRAFVFRKLMR